MDPLVSEFFEQGIAPATRAVYSSGWSRYLKFCCKFHVTPLPVTSESQTAFAAFLVQSVSAGTIHSYLAAIRFFQIRASLADPSLSLSPRLPSVLKGIQRSRWSQTCTRAKRLPVTPNVLMKIHTLWSKSPLTFDKITLWAAFCIRFFGFLRSGEFPHSPSQPHDECALTTDGVAIDSRNNPQVLTIRLRRSKTDPYGAGTHIYVGRTGMKLCPVSAMLAYLAIRLQTQGRLFIFKDGTPLSRNHLVHHLREALSQVDVDVSKFSQFPHWRSYNSRSSQTQRLLYSDTREVEITRIHCIYHDSYGGLGRSVSNAS